MVIHDSSYLPTGSQCFHNGEQVMSETMMQTLLFVQYGVFQTTSRSVSRVTQISKVDK